MGMVIHFVHASEEKEQTQVKSEASEEEEQTRVNGEASEEGTPIRCQSRSCHKI